MKFKITLTNGTMVLDADNFSAAAEKAQSIAILTGKTMEDIRVIARCDVDAEGPQPGKPYNRGDRR
jgi:hypothetical protein